MWHAMLPTVLVQVQCRLNSPPHCWNARRQGRELGGNRWIRHRRLTTELQ